MQRFLKDFRISVSRLSRKILKNADSVRLPSKVLRGLRECVTIKKEGLSPGKKVKKTFHCCDSPTFTGH